MVGLVVALICYSLVAYESGLSISPVEKHKTLVGKMKNSKQKEKCPQKVVHILNFLVNIKMYDLFN
jgi:hypothetical protein